MENIVLDTGCHDKISPILTLKLAFWFHLKLQLHDVIYQIRFNSNSLIHILSLSNWHNNVASIQKNRGDKSYRVIVALSYNYTMRFIGYDSIKKFLDSYLIAFKFAQ